MYRASFIILYYDQQSTYRESTRVASTYRLYIQPPHRLTL